MIKFVCDGIECEYDFNQVTGIIEVYDSSGRICNGELCDQTESFYYDYYNQEEGNLNQGGSIPDLYHRCGDNALELARWLVSTHPEH